MFIQFGIGEILLAPVGGNLPANPSPFQPITLQDVTLDITGKLVKLMGQNKGPDDVAPSDMEVKGDIGIGRMDVNLFNQTIFGESTSPIAGIDAQIPQEAHTVPVNPGPYTVAVAQAGANWRKDLGVRYASGPNAGQNFLRDVPGPPVATGHYSVNSTGTYTFFSGDAGAAIVIAYNWNDTSTGETLTVLNHLQGYGPVVEMYLRQPYQGRNGLHFFKVRFNGLNASLKRDNYQIPKMAWEAFPTDDLPPRWFEWFQEKL